MSDTLLQLRWLVVQKSQNTENEHSPRWTVQMLLQIPKKWMEYLELANVRVTTDVPAEEIVDPSYIPDDGEEKFEVVAHLLNTTPSNLKKADLDWFDQSWYRHFREELNELRERKTVIIRENCRSREAKHEVPQALLQLVLSYNENPDLDEDEVYVITVEHTVAHVCRAVVSGTYLRNLFAHRRLSETFELHRSEPFDSRKKEGIREFVRIMVALHRHLLKVSGMDKVEFKDRKGCLI